MTFWRTSLVTLLALAAAGAPAMARALELSHVHHEAAAFDPQAGESAVVRFRLPHPASVTLRVFDARDLEVRAIEAALEPGEQSLSWDGKDSQGAPVPPEAYRYTLEAKTTDGGSVRWDVSDLTGGETLKVTDVAWSPDEGVIRYVLPAHGRVNIRIGLKNDGPLLRTLLDWVPRLSGRQEARWDGFDSQGVLALAQHPNLHVVVSAFSLSNNTVLVLPAPDTVELIEGLSPELRRPTEVKPKRPAMFDYARHPVERRRDVAVELALPPNLRRRPDGVPIVEGPIAVRVDVSPADAERLLEERFETVFYIDGQFRFESEVGFLPVAWTWDPSGSNDGVHYITTNLRGYDGHFGISTRKVYVSRNGGTKP